MTASKDYVSPLAKVVAALQREGFAAAYRVCSAFALSGDLPPEELEDWALTGCEAADVAYERGLKAREILRDRDRSDRQKLQAIQRLMGWQRPSKRDDRELLGVYAGLISSPGTVTVRVRSGPRQGDTVQIESCPLVPDDALETLKQLYDAASTDAVLQGLHVARKRYRGTLRNVKLPSRR